MSLMLYAVLVAQIAGAQAPNSYRLTFTDDDRRSVRVTAQLATRDSMLLVFPDNYDASHLPDGWSTFFRGLRASDAVGQPVELQPAGRDRWRLPPGVRQPIALSYEVLIHHDQGYWPVGHDEAAYARRDCDCVFFTGMAVFIGARDLSDIQVEFDMPGPRPRVSNSVSWTSTTPWAPVPEREHTYRVPNFHELSEVALVVGRVPTTEFVTGASTVRLSIGRGLPDGLALFERAARDYMEGAARMIGTAPEGRFAIVANPESFTGGGAFIRSASMLFRDVPVPGNRRDWGHILAHELLHLWNGHAVQWQQSEEWWKEGGTDYLARKLQRATGDLTTEQFLDVIATQARYYLADGKAMSMRAAGAHKQEHGTLVYAGGALATMLADHALQRETNGRTSIEAVMSALYARHANTGRRIGMNELTEEMRALGGPESARLLTSWVESPQALPLEEQLAQAGLRLIVTSEGSPPIVRIENR